MAKNNQRSIRYTDEVAEIIEKLPGNGFNEKFEFLVLDYAKTVPDRVKELDNINEVIRNKKKRLKEVEESLRSIEIVKQKYYYFLDELKRAEIQLNKM